MKYLTAFLLAFSIFLLPAFADTSGDINTSLPQPIVTGFFAYTAGNCTQNYGNPPSGCGTYQCFFENGTTIRGQCRPPANTACYESGTWYATGSNGASCKNSTHKYSCSSGTWAASECSNGCSAGACASTTTTTTTPNSGNPGNTGDTDTTKKYTLSITSAIQGFNITQNTSATKTVTVKNTGEDRTNNTKLSVSGVPDGWASVSPSSASNLSIGASATFTVTFRIPANGTVKEHDVTLTAKSDQAETTSTFKLKVLPSAETVQNTIIPRYDGVKTMLEELEKNVTELKAAGVNTTEIEALLAGIKEKMEQANLSISSSDYFAASTAIDAIDALSAELSEKIEAARNAQGSNTLIIIVIAIVLIALGVVGYMLLPSKLSGMSKNMPWDDKEKGGFQPGKGFVPSETTQVSKIISDIQRKKKESARYQFGGKR